MPRPLHARVATVVLALLYFLAWGEPVALHPCPMHDGAGVMAVGATAGRDAHATGAAHAAHGAAMADMPAAAPGDHTPAGGHGDHTCQCLGHGCSAAAVALPAAQQVRWFAVVTRRADPPAAKPSVPPAVAPRHLHPPATGPPVPG